MSRYDQNIFRNYLADYTTIDSKDWSQIIACFHPKEVKAGTLLLEEGKICRHVYFLESGLLRYFVWKDGQDVTKFFTHPPYCFTSQRSFNTEQPARESIEALQDSYVWEMSRADSLRLLELKTWNNFVLKLVQEVQFFTERILEDLQNETAEQRYRRMIAEGSPLLQKVPLKHLASYLGIAPQSLSRIRKKIYEHART
ncbi:MAG: Crp/Fnr family transcriptional regulator [Bacteroidota bacterium]